jgi:tetratricopeptide (TPR) repeat protein
MPGIRTSYCNILSELGVRDERVYRILLEQYDEDIGAGAMYLGMYGDPRALPILMGDLDDIAVDPEDPAENHAIIELVEAIKDLGGSLTEYQKRKHKEVLEVIKRSRKGGLDRSVSTLTSRKKKLGRNEPCWCGSGKKYKKCHLDSDENPAKRREEPQAGEAAKTTSSKKKSAKKNPAKNKRKRRKDAKHDHVKLTLIEGGGDRDVGHVPPLPDRRAMEGMMAGVFGGRAGDPNSRAQELMYHAWESRDPRERLSLAREALEVSVDCADAYVMLAEEAAESLGESIKLYRRGVEAGERCLGEQVFEEDVGHFWGLLETRPYMRARAGLAGCLWTAGQRDEAIEHYRDLLRLNPGDNQGIRYTLLPCLLEQGRDEEALELQQQFDDDGSAAWSYATALLRFRQEGNTDDARRALDEARACNPHVPAFLLGKRRMPTRLPDFIGFGDESEAVAYVADNAASWKKTAGALDWLRSNNS